MKVTVEVPDDVHRQAKASAAELDITLSQFVTEAVAVKLEMTPGEIAEALSGRRP